ncbi:hypothetical protein ACFYVL_44435 [Streptomyces sp. NPDC004111]
MSKITAFLTPVATAAMLLIGFTPPPTQGVGVVGGRPFRDHVC